MDAADAANAAADGGVAAAAMRVWRPDLRDHRFAAATESKRYWSSNENSLSAAADNDSSNAMGSSCLAVAQPAAAAGVTG